MRGEQPFSQTACLHLSENSPDHSQLQGPQITHSPLPPTRTPRLLQQSCSTARDRAPISSFLCIAELLWITAFPFRISQSGTILKLAESVVPLISEVVNKSDEQLVLVLMTEELVASWVSFHWQYYFRLSCPITVQSIFLLTLLSIYLVFI